ncbi:MAG: PKD domain-containing protein [Bacteroidetes bacterium]|nr:PKD domain-containing protein [Bacteroidota bacterium]
MKYIIKQFIFILFIFISVKTNAQVVIQSQCPNADFSYHDFTNWNGCYCLSHAVSCYTAIMYSGPLSNCTPIAIQPIINCGTQGFLSTGTIARPSLHTILTPSVVSYPNPNSPSLTGLYDSLTNYNLRKIPATVNQVVRLNSWMNTYETSQMSYKIQVDTTVSGLFVYSFAAVLENPSHNCVEQPYFQIRITDTNNIPINNTCGNFTYVSGTPGSYVKTCTAFGHTINWFDWQTIGLNLKSYHGQHIKIHFIASDCGEGGHFGYAYFYGYSDPRNLGIAYCPGSTSAVITAPSGFRYKWLPMGDTTQSITISNPIDSTIYKVVISSKLSSTCTDTLSCMLLPNTIHPDFTITNACAGSPVTFTRTTTSNVAINNWRWDFGNPGSADNKQNNVISPTHIYSTAGTYYVKLVEDTASACPDSVTKTVIVFPKPVLTVIGDSVCQGDTAKLTVSGANKYLWSNGDTAQQIWVHPFTTYPSDTTFNYKVIGTTSHACKDTAIAKVLVYSQAQIAYLRDKSFGCIPLTINWNNQTTPFNSTFMWYFGDGDSSLFSSPTHTYLNSGLYNVTINAFTPEGCKSSFIDSFSIHVLERPLTPIITKHGDTLIAYDPLYTQYQWYLFDTIIPGANQYFYIPVQIGYYSVIAQNIWGCFSLPSINVLSIDKSVILSKTAILNNPTADYFGIYFNRIVTRVDILDYRGILLKTYPKRNIDNAYYVGDLAKGIYIVRIYADGRINNLKLVKY